MTPRQLFCVWFGEWTDNRKRCLDDIYQKCGVPVTLITSENLDEWVPGKLLHPAFKYLSAVHKSDYLRPFLMFNYGGGYMDVKMCHHDWRPWFDALDNSDKWCSGYTEVGPHGTALPELKPHWQKLIGNGWYIFKPHTLLAGIWYAGMLYKMDEKAELLAKHPAVSPRRQPAGYPYPLRWAELLGEQFHSSVYAFHNNVLHGMPLIDCDNYL